MATGIGLVGSYGGLNLGDEAILQVIVRSLRQALPGCRIVAFSRDAAHTERHHDVDRAVPVRQLSQTALRQEVAALDAVILGGGGTLFDTEAATFLRSIAVAQRLARFTMAFAIGAGPLDNWCERAVVRGLVNRIDVVSVRSHRSRRLLWDVGITRDVSISLDPAFLLDPELVDDRLRDHLAGVRVPLVGISVREPGPACPNLAAIPYHRYVAALADHVVRRLRGHVLFIPMERQDLDHARTVMQLMRQRRNASMLTEVWSPGQTLALVHRLQLAIGMRLHFLSFAACARVPFVPLPFVPKLAELPGHLAPRLSAAGPETGPATVQSLVKEFECCWEERESRRSVLTTTIDEVRAQAMADLRLAHRQLEVGAAGRERVHRGPQAEWRLHA